MLSILGYDDPGRNGAEHFKLRMKAIRVWYVAKASLSSIAFEGYLGVQPAYYFQLTAPLVSNLGSLQNVPLLLSTTQLGYHQYPLSSVYLQTLEVTFSSGSASNPSVINLSQHNDVFEMPFRSPQKDMDVTLQVWTYLNNVVYVGAATRANLGALVEWMDITALGVSLSTSLVCCSPPFNADCQPNFAVTFTRQQWTHLACSLTYSTRYVRGFINGVHIGSYQIPSAFTAYTLKKVRIGAASGTYSYYLDASLYDIRCWSTVRSAAEIQENYKKYLSPHHNPDLMYYVPGHDRFYQGLKDHSFQGFAMSSTHGPALASTNQIPEHPLFTQPTLQFCQEEDAFNPTCDQHGSWVLRFDHTKTPYLQITGNSVISAGAPPVTYEAWVYAFDFPAASSTYLFDSFASVRFATTGAFTFSVTNDKDYYTADPITTNTWHHLSFAFQYSGSNGHAVYYLTAQQKKRVALAYSSSQSGKNYLKIGFRTATANTDGWNGYIQHFRVWKSYRDTYPRQYIYEVPRASIADLVVDFPLGQDVGNFQVDRSLNFLSITTSSISTKFVEEYKGQHFCGAGSWFDGQKCNDSGGFQITRTAVSSETYFTYSSEALSETPSQVTFTFWFYVDSSSLQASSYTLIDDQPGGYFFYFQWNSGYNGFYFDVCSRTGRIYNIGTAAIYNKWSHFAITGLNPFTGYFNGAAKSISVSSLLQQNAAGTFSCQGDLRLMLGTDYGVAFKEFALYKKILNYPEILYLANHNSPWGLDYLLFYLPLDDGDYLIRNKVSQWGRYFAPETTWPVWTPSKQQLKICEGRQGRLVQFNGRLGQCQNKRLAYFCPTCKLDLSFSSITPSSLRTSVTASATTADLLVGFWIHFLNPLETQKYAYIASFMTSSGDRALSLRVGPHFQVSFQSGSAQSQKSVDSLLSVSDQTHHGKWLHLFLSLRYSSIILHLNGFQIPMNESPISRDLSAFSSITSLRFGDSAFAFNNTIEDVVWLNGGTHTVSQRLNAIFNTGIKYLSAVAFYFPIAEQFASGIPVLSDSSQITYIGYDLVQWQSPTNSSHYFLPSPPVLSNQQQLSFTLPSMANSGTCRFAFTSWIYLTQQDSLGRMTLALNGAAYFTLTLGSQKFAIQYAGASLIDKVLYQGLQKQWVLAVFYRNSSNHLYYNVNNMLIGSASVAACSADHHGGTNTFTVVGEKHFSIHSFRYWYNPIERDLNLEKLLLKSRREVPRARMTVKSLKVYEYRFFHSPGACYALQVSDRNEASNTGVEVMNYGQDFFTYADSTSCIYNPYPSPFEYSASHQVNHQTPGPSLCLRDQLFTGSRCVKDKYMKVQNEAMQPLKIYTDPVTVSDFTLEGWFYEYTKIYGDSYVCYISLAFTDGQYLELGYGASKQYQSLNIFHLGTVYYYDDYTPLVGAWQHFALTCYLQSNQHRCPVIINGVQRYEVPLVGTRYNIPRDLWVGGNIRTVGDSTTLSAKQVRFWKVRRSVAEVAATMRVRPTEVEKYSMYNYFYLDGSDISADNWLQDQAKSYYPRRHKIIKIYEPTGGPEYMCPLWFLSDDYDTPSLLICEPGQTYDSVIQLCVSQGGLALPGSKHNSTMLYPKIISSSQKLKVPFPTVASAADEVTFWAVEVWIRIASVDNSDTSVAGIPMIHSRAGSFDGIRLTLDQSGTNLVYYFELELDTTAKLSLGRGYLSLWQHLSISSDGIGFTEVILDRGSSVFSDSNIKLLTTAANFFQFPANSGATLSLSISEFRIWKSFKSRTDLQILSRHNALHYMTSLSAYFPLFQRQMSDYRSDSLVAVFTPTAEMAQAGWIRLPPLSLSNMTFPESLLTTQFQIPEDRTLTLSVSLNNACNEGFGITQFVRFESEVPLASSSLAQIPSLFLLSLDDSNHTVFTFSGTSATTSNTATHGSWLVVGGFYDRNSGNIFAKLGPSLSSSSFQKKKDMAAHITAAVGRSLQIGGRLKFSVKHIALWQDPRIGRFHSFNEFQYSKDYSPLSKKALLHYWVLLPDYNLPILTDLVNSNEQALSPVFLNQTDSIDCSKLMQSSTSYSTESSSYCRLRSRTLLLSPRSAPLVLDETATGLKFTGNVFSLSFLIYLPSMPGSKVKITTISDLVIFHLNTNGAGELNGFGTAVSAFSSGSWLQVVLIRNLSWQRIYIDDSTAHNGQHNSFDLTGVAVKFIFHDEVSVLLRQVQLYDGEPSRLYFKQNAHRRPSYEYANLLLAYYPFNEQQGNYVYNALAGTQFTLTLSGGWTGQVAKQPTVCEQEQIFESNACVNTEALSLRHEAADLLINTGSFDITADSGVTASLWISLSAAYSTQCASQCTIFEVASLLKLSMKPVTVNSILQTNYMTLSYQPLTKTAFQGNLLTQNWYFVAVSFSTAAASLYSYEVLNTGVVKAYTDIVSGDMPGTLTSAMAFGSSTLASSADFAFKHAAVFRSYQESAFILQEQRNSLVGLSSLVFFSYGERKVSFTENDSEILGGLTLNSTSPSVPKLCHGNTKYLAESTTCQPVSKQFIIKEKKLPLTTTQHFTVALWVFIPSTPSIESGLGDSSSSLLNLALSPTGGGVLMAPSQLEAIARNTRFYADSTARTDSWIFIKYSAHYLRRFELYVREADATISQARGEVDSTPEASVNALFFHNRGEVILAQISLWHFAVPNQLLKDNIDQLAKYWTPSHVYHFKGYGGNLLFDRAPSASPVTLGLDSDDYYWIYREVSERPGKSFFRLDLSGSSGFTCTATQFWNTAASTCDASCPTGTSHNSAKICLGTICTTSLKEDSTYCSRQTQVVLSVTRDSVNDLTLTLTVQSTDTSLSSTDPEYWFPGSISIKPEDISISISGDLSSYKISHSFSSTEITRVKDSSITLSIDTYIENTLQGDEVATVKLNPKGQLATNYHFVDTGSQTVLLASQENPALFNNNSVWKLIFQIIAYLLLVIVLLSLVVQICTQKLLSNVWQLVAILQLYYLLVFVNVPFNKHVENFLKAMDLMFGIFFSAFPQILNQDDDSNDHALSPRFQEMGVKKMNVLSLFGSQAFFLALYFLLALILRPFVKKCKDQGSIQRARVCRILCMEWFLRTLFLLFLSLCFFTFIGYHYSGSFLVTLFAYLFLLTIFVICILTSCCASREASSLIEAKRPPMIHASSLLLCDLSLQQNWFLQSQYYFVFLARRAIFAAAIVFLRDEPFWQFGSLIFCSMMVIAYLLRSHPYKVKGRIVLDIIEEVLLIGICAVYAIVVKTEETRDSKFILLLGVIIIGSVLFSVATRVTLTFIQIKQSCKTKSRKKIRRNAKIDLDVTAQPNDSFAGGDLSISNMSMNLPPSTLDSPNAKASRDFVELRSETPKSLLKPFSFYHGSKDNE